VTTTYVSTSPRPSESPRVSLAVKGTERVVIESVTPSVDCGRYPIKRALGGRVDVGADIFKDGHDLISARIVYCHADDRADRVAPLEFEFNPDRWFGSFRPDALGRWQYGVEAWPDPIRTWSVELRKRVEAGQDTAPELLEGARLLRIASARPDGGGGARQQLLDVAARLEATSAPIYERLSLALSDVWHESASGPLRPEDVARFAPMLGLVVDREEAAFAVWYELFPRSQTASSKRHGTFADVERRLPELASLGFDVIYLPPIHPIGRDHRKGKNNALKAAPDDVGSPWAIGAREGGHAAVHPELGTVDDFVRLVRAAKEFGMEIAIDFALQCAPDHPWVKEHPEWFFVRVDGSVRYAEYPPKKYEDIYPLNLWCADREALWDACRDLLLYWAARGVRSFRVDNPHTKPLAFWEWVIAEVQRAYPDVVFLSEAFTRPKRMKTLSKLGFSQSYTYFTWKNTKEDLVEYLTELTQTEMTEYFRPNFFANTPDILHEYLQTGGRPAFRARLLLAGTLAPVYGLYSGYELCEHTPLHPGSEEYLNSEKYQIVVRDWNAPGNIKQDVARLNRIRRENPALQRLDNLTFLETDSDEILAFAKRAYGNEIIVVVNLDPHRVHETMVDVPGVLLGLEPGSVYQVFDLMSGERYQWQAGENYVRLDPLEKPGHLFRIERS
jgi:starch synthase (maltosyl-transferring)